MGKQTPARKSLKKERDDLNTIDEIVIEEQQSAIEFL